MTPLGRHVGRKSCFMFASLIACALLASATPALADGGGWVDFSNETSTRLLTDDPLLGPNDPEEKDYAWGDVDNDGDIDLVVMRKQPFTTTGRRVNVLYLNEGIADGHDIDGVMVDRTAEYVSQSTVSGDLGFLTPTNDRDVVLADVNGDDWLDIITATTLSDGAPKHISHPRIYINLGEIDGVWQGFRFENERFPLLATLNNGDAYAPRFCAVAAGDIDNDGDNDLYFVDYDQGPAPPEGFGMEDQLFLNDGNGFFVDATNERLTNQMVNSAFGMSTAIADMNNDGALDIVKDTALSPPTYVGIIYNDPDNVGFFESLDIIYTNSPYHTTVGNLNNDEWLDLVVTDDGTDRYMLGLGTDGNGQTQYQTINFTFQVGSDGGFGGNSVIADMNNDGFNDVYLCGADVDAPQNCSRPTHLFRNLGNLPAVTLQDQDGQAPWEHPEAHDAALFDINGDGWNDMIVGACVGTFVWMNIPPQSLIFSYPQGLPGNITPDEITTFPVEVSGLAIDPVPGTGKQFVSIDGGPFVESSMIETEPNAYTIELPPTGCPSVIRFYVMAGGSDGEDYTDPPGAPFSTFSSLVILHTIITLDERFEEPTPDWTVESEDLTGGEWERVDPVGTIFAGDPAQPEDDFGAAAEETKCYITQQHTGGDAFSSDVDGGPTTLTSPVIDVEGADANISYARWLFSAPAGEGDIDPLVTQVTNDGSFWVTVDSTFGTGSMWEVHSFRVSHFVVPTATVQVRFVVSDNPNNSVTEAGIDSFVVERLVCTDDVPPEIAHGLGGVEFAGAAFGGFIDSRRESDNGVDLNQGIDQITISFTEPVVDAGGVELTSAAFTLSETGGGDAPAIIGYQVLDLQKTIRLDLDRIITLQEWLTVAADVEDFAGNAIINLGDLGPGVDETDRVDLAFLPTDVDQSGVVSPFDLLRFRQIVNGIFIPSRGVPTDYADTDRNGAVTPFDLLTFRQLINGISPPATQSWSGAALNNPRP